MTKKERQLTTIQEIVKGLKVQHLSIKNDYKKIYNKEVNDLLIEMLEYVDIDKMECERTSKGFNRGVIGENIVKYHIFSYLEKCFNGLKSLTNTCDIDLRKCDNDLLSELGLKRSTYEIKTLTKVANAHASAHNNKNYIILDLKYNNSVVLVDSNQLVYDNSGHVVGYNKYETLDLLSELVGL